VTNFRTEKGPGIHLIAVRASGFTSIYAIEKDDRTHKFHVAIEPVQVEAVPQCFPYGSYVLDSASGVRCVASRSRYSDFFQGESVGADVYWITAGHKGLRCSMNADGNRLGRVDFGSKNGVVESACVVHKHSMWNTTPNRSS
jgi:syntaxin-binding protein 5